MERVLTMTESPYIEAHGEEYLGCTAFDPATNRIIWAIKYDDPFSYGNFDRLNHEYLHWLLENFVSVEASIKFDHIEARGYFDDLLLDCGIENIFDRTGLNGES
jgi:hypothetical protein